LSDPHSPDQLIDSIRDGLTALGMQPEAHPVDTYIRYLQLLQKWNSAYNLTAIRDPEQMVTHHILDSLSVLPYLRGDDCLDVGTGAGLPGLVLALAAPEKHWILLDSNRKKIRFVNQAIIELKPGNVETVCIRAGQYRPDKLFSTIICRAFASLGTIYTQTRHLLAPGGSLLAMKGHDIHDELAGLDEGTVSVQIHTLNVPGIQEQRSLVEIKALR
jgi:16S rRNA (guanine527-N7)-methyltransferase